LKTDFFICIDKYIREGHPCYKDIVTSRYYEKKSVSEISEKYQELKTEVLSCLKSKDWTHEDFNVLDIAEFDYMPEVVKKESPEKYESISRFLSENNNRAAFFVKDRYPEGLREAENPELIKKWFGVEYAPSSAYSPEPVPIPPAIEAVTSAVEAAPSSGYNSGSAAPMTPQTILEILGNHISVILEKFKTEEKKRFVGFLSEIEIAGTGREGKERSLNLFKFCMGFSFLKEIFLSARYSYAADTGITTRGLKFKGEKSPSPQAKEENQVHLLANELIRIVEDDLKESEE
jgi:hypothetical protein